jgi:uncharacterized protein YecT (DUF1311 family)
MPLIPRLLSLAVLGLALLGPAVPASGAAIKTQFDLNADAAQSAADADRRLNAAYKKLVAVLTPAEKQKLLAAQLAWLKYRDASAAFAHQESGGGQAAPMARSGMIRQLSLARASDFERVLELRGKPAVRMADGTVEDAELRKDHYEWAAGEVIKHEKKLLAELDAGTRAAYQKAAQAWARFRDAEVAFTLTWDESNRSLVRYDCLANLTEARADALQAILEKY